MLRVLHCIYDDPKNPWLGGGGAHRVAEIYRRLAGRVAVTVATGNFPGARDEESDGIRYIRLGARTPYLWSRLSYAHAATALLSRAEYEVGIYDFSAYTPVRIPRGRPVGVIVHMLMGPTAEARWGRVLGPGLWYAERALLRRARWISTVSSWTAEQLRALVPPTTEIRVVGNGVPDLFHRVERADQGYLLYYGRFDVVQKGLDTLLRAMAILVRDRPSLKLIVAGRGKDAARLPGMARELGITANVHIREGVTREETLALFAGAAMLLMPSRFEGLPIVPMEAMAAGVPVVASAVGGTPEVVAAPEGGLLVPPDDPEALARAADELLSDAERRFRISRVARRLAERFSWSRVAEEHFSFLEHVAASAGSIPRRSANQ